MDSGVKLSKQSEQVLKTLLSFEPGSIHDRIFGCLFGQLLGDALGSYLEFKKKVSDVELKAALQMPGGGCFMTAPGQVTDDSEMAIELLYGIRAGFNQEKIAEGYDYWCNNGPFDIGRTTSRALKRSNQTRPRSLAEYQTQNSIERNGESLSNGCLMRISPLAIYFASRNIFDWSQIKDITRKDTQLTHSNIMVQQLVQVWVYMLTKIINIKNSDPTQEIAQILQSCDQIVMNCSPRVQKWYKAQKEPDFAKNIGCAKKCFKFGFQTLRKFDTSITFRSYMANVLKRGGDTDTNGCILGAMIGGIVGFHSIYKENPQMVYKSLECKPNHQRERYKPIVAVVLTLEMISQMGPQQYLEINPQIQPQPSADVLPVLTQLFRIKPNTFKDRIFGCIFGQLLGDALGSHLEFRQNIDEKLLNYAFSLPEGGQFNKAAGAISSDSEMAMELLNVIKNGFSQEKIAQGYDDWCQNSRIQLGKTTRNALYRSKNEKIASYAKTQISKAQELNQQSLSNGCLMRISQLAIFSSLNPQLNQSGELTKQDTELTHSNVHAQEIVQVWVKLLTDLIKIKDLSDINHVLNDSMLKARSLSDAIGQIDYTKQPESLKSIESYLVEAYRTLKDFNQAITFKSYITKIIMMGGDTDTNACIMGSMIGAVLGFSSIYKENPEWIHKLLNCQPKNQSIKYRPLLAILDTFEMINQAPHKK